MKKDHIEYLGKEKGKEMIKRNVRKGIAMIELIFALVIMGIVLLSAPMLIQQSIASSNVALQQESIAAIALHTGILLSKHWDESNTIHTVGVSPILTLTNPVTGSNFNFSGIKFDNNVSGRTSSVAGEEFNASTLSQDNNDSNDFNDLDDYNNNPMTLEVFLNEDSSAGTLGDYVDKNITIATIVTYADDRPSSTFDQTTIEAGNKIFGTQSLAGNVQSHIKFVQTTLTTTATADELDKTITLNAFSCNLGTYSLGGRQYQ
jgi:Tfp pilus assembly protein PilV